MSQVLRKACGLAEEVTRQAMTSAVTACTVMWRKPGKVVTESGSDGAHRA